MDTLARFSQWYLRRCDGNWEHYYGFQISTLDNPGIAVDIDLLETELKTVPFDEQKDQYESPDQWMICRRTAEKFEARGAASRFEDMLRVFLDWADENEQANDAVSSDAK